MTLTRPLLATAFAACTALPAAAQDPEAAIAARQGQMNVQAFNLGILGNMARGRIDYDAEMARMAAANVAAVGMMEHAILWPEGTDNTAMETRALPLIWEDMDGFMAIWADYATASVALAEVAGDGLDALRGAIGPVGETCGACHETYRQPR